MSEASPAPASVPLTKQFFSNYIDEQVRFEPQNQRLANVLINWFCGLVPGPMRGNYRTFLLSKLGTHVDGHSETSSAAGTQAESVLLNGD
jgi:hypothetical protein